VNPFDCIPDEEFDTTLEAFDFLLGGNIDDVEGILVDLDGVLMDVHGSHPPPEVGVNVDETVLKRLKALDERYGACIVTNRIRYSDFDPEHIEAVFGLPVVTDTKPKPRAEMFHKGVAELGVDHDRRGNVVMVGDSSIFDTYAAKRAGLQTLQVDQDRSKYHVHQMAGKWLADTLQSCIKLVHAGYQKVR
jgi:phosphoglycolate phosphatase-like HAD superfamily hydrolase